MKQLEERAAEAEERARLSQHKVRLQHTGTTQHICQSMLQAMQCSTQHIHVVDNRLEQQMCESVVASTVSSMSL